MAAVGRFHLCPPNCGAPPGLRGVTPPPPTWTVQTWSSGGAESELRPGLGSGGPVSPSAGVSRPRWTGLTCQKQPWTTCLCVYVPSAAWTSRSHAGAETTCVPGSRTRVWVCTWTRLRTGSSPDRRCCRRRSTTWRRWDGPGGPGTTSELRLKKDNALCYHGYTRACLLCRS